MWHWRVAWDQHYPADLAVCWVLALAGLAVAA